MKTLATWFLLIGTAVSAAPLGPNCERLEEATIEHLRAYLAERSAEDRTDALCTEFAILNVGAKHNSQDIDLLLKYLTFKRDPTELEKEGVVHRLGTRYPAVDALMSYGPGSGNPPLGLLKRLVKYLAEPSVSDVQIGNVADVISYYYREEPAAGVRFLMAESKGATGPGAATLRTAASVLVKRCGNKAQQQCLEELENDK